jgi:hypothetical protein
MTTLKRIFNKKGIVTTSIGVIAILGLAYKIYIEKGISVEDFLILMTAVGLIAAKDQNKTHTTE